VQLGASAADWIPPAPRPPAPSAANCFFNATGTACAVPCCRSEVNIYVEVPQGVRAKQLTVSIKPQHLSVGIKDLPAYLDVSCRHVCSPGPCPTVLGSRRCKLVIACCDRLDQDIFSW
jgi:hypothetical protein